MPRPSPNRRPKASIACDACRKRKTKCSGDIPCSSCQRRSISCTVAEDSRRIVVSERYLQSLHRRIKQLESANGSAEISDFGKTDSGDGNLDASPVGTPETLYDDATTQSGGDALETDLGESPFPNDTSFIKVSNGSAPGERWVYVAQSSSWSFVFRITDLLQEVTPAAREEQRFPLDGDAYPLTWEYAQVDESQWLQAIPAQDYAIYLLNSFKFHLGHRLHLLDHEDFAKQITSFYNNPRETMRSSRLWYVQFLIILAFGKAFVERTRIPGSPPGFNFFARAMSLLPSLPELQSSEPILAVEVLALISLYMYCVDHKASSYAYIGQAARLAMHSGLHTRLPVDRFGIELAQRYNSLWWSVYILDRHISSTSGCPTAVHEEDITAPLPVTLELSEGYIIYTLHVKISRLVSKVLSTIYVPDNVMDRTFLQRTRHVLKSLARLAKELEDTIRNRLQGPVQVDLASVAFLTQAYHECAILATRPIVLSLLKRRLRHGAKHAAATPGSSSRLQSLIDTCANSAAKVIDILTVRLDNNMIEAFLPFQLETLSSALVVLLVINSVYSTDHNFQLLEDRAHAIFDDLIAQKNPVAKYRKAEATNVKELLTSMGPSAGQARGGENASTLQEPQIFGLNNVGTLNGFSVTVASANLGQQLTPATPLTFPMVPDDDFLLNFGLSSEALDSVADHVIFDSPLGDIGSWGSS